MYKKMFAVVLLFLSGWSALQAQGKLSIDNVYSAYLRNSGTIMEKQQIKGYFFFYLSDKVDRKTNEYTLQILDENLNKVKDIKFEDNKNVNLLEAAYNGNSLSFLFQDEKERKLTMKIYSMEGKLLRTYINEYSRKTEEFMKMYNKDRADNEATNQHVFDVGEKGFVSVMPVKDGKDYTYEMDFYGSQKKAYWKYIPDDKNRFAVAEYLGNTDSLIILQVLSRRRLLSNAMKPHLVGINFITKKVAFDLEGDEDEDEYRILPTSIKRKSDGTFLVMGPYCDKDANPVKSASKGLAVYEMNTAGKILSRKYNSWETDFAKYLHTSSKGKIDEIGYLCIHNLILSADGKLTVVGEGYKRQVSAGGTALKALSIAAGGVDAFNATKITITDMVVMTFDEHFNVTGAQIFNKTNNAAATPPGIDYVSQHMIALALKSTGAFDYDFTTSDEDNETFSICYSDYERTGDYKGQTFNTIHYNGSKFKQDKIKLKSNASKLKVFPAKPGSVMILEYFKKEKRIDVHLEKIS
ncbi:DUF6770 family protein [Chitinophaga ginsengisegetis]|uniref:DUF6770 family protein n=1 Tax=Chitinophaga ginsengisegetis TaxID=393003 RepID=UPI000DB94255|nr:DUF6770 family protein [Chitinophaga ginsengisegetis]MDR6567477.1 hypothetical protein [Chitinophaga ginsengisegetis]MDR6647208.1 hypothetical protein [Chitinophaga ginsengisegetis]MDR6653557.1 hypothetical protein [Chitinophaga ginsengisegetis]